MDTLLGKIREAWTARLASVGIRTRATVDAERQASVSVRQRAEDMNRYRGIIPAPAADTPAPPFPDTPPEVTWEDRRERLIRRVESMGWPWPVLRARGPEPGPTTGLLLLVGAPRDRPLVKAAEEALGRRNLPWMGERSPESIGRTRFARNLVWDEVIAGAGWRLEVMAAPEVINEAWGWKSYGDWAEAASAKEWVETVWDLEDRMQWMAGVAREAAMGWREGPCGMRDSEEEDWAYWTRMRTAAAAGEGPLNERKAREARMLGIVARIAREEGIGAYPEEVARLAAYAGLDSEGAEGWPAELDDWKDAKPGTLARYAAWVGYGKGEEAEKRGEWHRLLSGEVLGAEGARTWAAKAAMTKVARGEPCGICSDHLPKANKAEKDTELAVFQPAGTEYTGLPVCRETANQGSDRQQCRFLQQAREEWGWDTEGPAGHPLDEAIWGQARRVTPRGKQAITTRPEGHREGRDGSNPEEMEPRLGIARTQRTLGFAMGGMEATGEGIAFPDEGHVMTIAPTGAGKTSGQIVPVLLSTRKNAVVVDLKGEIFALTARRREEMGHKVYAIDPCGRVPERYRVSIDVLAPVTRKASANAWRGFSRKLQEESGKGKRSKRTNDTFWSELACNAVAAVAAHVGTDLGGGEDGLQEIGRIGNLRSTALKRRLEAITQCSADPLARQIQGLWPTSVEMENGYTASVRGTIQHTVTWLDDPAVAQATRGGGLDPEALAQSEGTTVYLVVPPERAAGLRKLLALLVGSLIEARLEAGPEAAPTLYVIDETALLGEMEALRTAITLSRGYGVQVWSAWQDLAQMEHHYDDWLSLVANSSVVCAFGTLPGKDIRLLVDRFGTRAPEQVDLEAMQGGNAAAYLRPGGRSGMMDLDWYWKAKRYEGLYDEVPRPRRSAVRGGGQDRSL